MSTEELMLLNCGVGEDSWESLGHKEIQPVHPEGNHSWIFFGRNDADAETPILWPPNVKNWLIGKDSDVGKEWRQENKAIREDAMVGWHHWLDGHEFEQSSGVGDGQGSLMYCNPRGRKESDVTEQLNWTEPPSPCQFNQLCLYCTHSVSRYLSTSSMPRYSRVRQIQSLPSRSLWLSIIFLSGCLAPSGVNI